MTPLVAWFSLVLTTFVYISIYQSAAFWALWTRGGLCEKRKAGRERRENKREETAEGRVGMCEVRSERSHQLQNDATNCTDLVLSAEWVKRARSLGRPNVRRAPILPSLPAVVRRVRGFEALRSLPMPAACKLHARSCHPPHSWMYNA